MNNWARLCTNGYLLGLLLCLFGWPVVLGFGSVWLRLIWVALAAACIAMSYQTVQQTVGDGSLKVTTERIPWWLIGGVGLLLAAIGAYWPVAYFTDEANIAIVPLAIGHRLIGGLSWPGTLAALGIASGVGLFVVTRATSKQMRWLAIGVIALTVVIAIVVPFSNSVAVRYSPIVRLVQTTVAVITQANPDLMRLPNVVWLVLTGIAIWRLAPQWSPLARSAAWLTLILTPVGWTYRILLFQAGGEVCFGLVTTLLCTQIFRGRPAAATYTGICIAAWTLYRPSGLFIAVTVSALLWLLRERQAAKTVAKIALPIGLLWVAVYFLGMFQHPIFSAEDGRVLAWYTVWLPVVKTVAALPSHLSWWGFGITVLGSGWIIWRGDRTAKLCLLFAWFIGGVHTTTHQWLLLEQWYGYGRFTLLLLLPLSCVLGSLGNLMACNCYRRLSAVLLLGLALSTPWNLPTFLQQMRTVGQTEVERTVTGGALITGSPRHIRTALEADQTPVLLVPGTDLLDTYISIGLITPKQRSAIVDLSASWTPESTQRPVIVEQTLSEVSYYQGSDASWDQTLRQATQWALAQPNVQSYPFGPTTTLVVP